MGRGRHHRRHRCDRDHRHVPVVGRDGGPHRLARRAAPGHVPGPARDRGLPRRAERDPAVGRRGGHGCGGRCHGHRRSWPILSEETTLEERGPALAGWNGTTGIWGIACAADHEPARGRWHHQRQPGLAIAAFTSLMGVGAVPAPRTAAPRSCARAVTDSRMAHGCAACGRWRSTAALPGSGTPGAVLLPGDVRQMTIGRSRLSSERILRSTMTRIR